MSYDTHLLTSLSRDYLNSLLNDTIPFWFPRAVDTECGGFLHSFDHDGSLLDSDKSVWAQGRMTWMLLTLYNTVEQRPEWLQWAEQGLMFLNNHCFDTDGQMFFRVTRDGKPLHKRRYAYSEAFAAIAHAAYARATGCNQSATRARELFERFVRWNFSPGLQPSKFTDIRPMIGMGPRMITIVTAQELRDNLGPDPLLNGWIDHCIKEIRDYFIKPEWKCVMETVGPDGAILDHFDGRCLNPGHAIEGAWFIMLEGKIRNEEGLIRLGCDMLDWMWARGWDTEYGGLFYFRDLHDKPVQEYYHDMKFWWPHDEALIATLLAHLLTGEERYLTMHKQVHSWSLRHFSDPVGGEWYGYLHRDGTPSVRLKGNLWKSFFHHPRSQWLCWKLLSEHTERT